MELKKVRSFYSLEQHWQSLLQLFFTFERESIELAYELMKSQGLTESDLDKILVDCGYFKLLRPGGFPELYFQIDCGETYINCSPLYHNDDKRIGFPDFWPERVSKSPVWTFYNIYDYFEAQPLDLSSLKISDSVKRLAFIIKGDSELILPMNIPENVIYFEITIYSPGAAAPSLDLLNCRIYCENFDETKEKYPNVLFDNRFIQKPK